MKTLLWKELRENSKWALLAMVAFGAALGYALFTSSEGYMDFYFNDGVTLCKKRFLLVTTFGAPAIALFLGLMQIVPELGRDRWAALLHRPVSRGTIFWGKVFAGLLLYTCAVFIPFALAVWVVATPGNFGAPFVPAMVQPGIADLTAGYCYYFAALVMALHRGGLLITRALPLLAAVHVSYFAQNADLFRVAVEAVFLMLAAMIPAAWGAMQNASTVQARPWFARLGFLAVIYYGALGVGDVGVSLVNALAPQPESRYSNYEFTREGRPLILNYENDVVMSVTELDRTPVSDPKLQPDRVRNQVSSLNLFAYYIGDSHGWKRDQGASPYRRSYSYLSPESPYQFPRLEQWFRLDHPDVMLSYLPLQKRAVDRLDAGGFRPLAAPVNPFGPGVEIENLGDGICAISSTAGAKFVFLPTREIVDLALPAAGPIFGSGGAWAYSPTGTARAVGFALTGGMAMYDAKAKLLAMLPYSRDVSRWGMISVGFNSDQTRFFMNYEPSIWLDSATKRKMPSYLDIVDREGKVVESYTLPPLKGSSHGTPLSTTLVRRLQSPAVYLGTVVYRQIGAMLGSERMKGKLAWQFGQGWSVTREILIGSIGISLGLAGVTVAWARRVRLPWPVAIRWAVLVLGFNLAGLIVFRLVADWPRLVACIGCKKPRPVDAGHCASCGAGWTPPAPNGLEIFDGRNAGTAA